MRRVSIPNGFIGAANAPPGKQSSTDPARLAERQTVGREASPCIEVYPRKNQFGNALLVVAASWWTFRRHNALPGQMTQS